MKTIINCGDYTKYIDEKNNFIICVYDSYEDAYDDIFGDSHTFTEPELWEYIRNGEVVDFDELTDSEKKFNAIVERFRAF